MFRVLARTCEDFQSTSTNKGVPTSPWSCSNVIEKSEVLVPFGDLLEEDGRPTLDADFIL